MIHRIVFLNFNISSKIETILQRIKIKKTNIDIKNEAFDWLKKSHDIFVTMVS